MPLVKAPLLARVDDRDLTARPKPRPQLRRCDAARCCWHPLPSSVIFRSVCPNSRDASKPRGCGLHLSGGGEEQRKSRFLQWNGHVGWIKPLFISTTCTANSLLSGSMEFCRRSTNSSGLINRKTIEFVRDELLAGWFDRLDINITLAISYPVWCEDNMAAIVIRNLSLETHRALQARAARHNRSTEAEARMILDEAVRPVARIKLG